MPASGNSKTSISIGSCPLSSFGVQVSVSLPAPGIFVSSARYWSPKAWRPTMIGFVQPGTSRGMFSITIGSRKITPPRMFRIVPLGERYIFFRPNSSTRASSGVIVAHLTPTPNSLMASAASTVTWSSVSSRCSMPRSKYFSSTSRYGRISFSLMNSHSTWVISSPSSSTSGVFTLILSAIGGRCYGSPPARGLRCSRGALAFLHRPRVAVGVGEEREPAPGELLHRARLDAGLDELRARRLRVVHHDLQALERAGRRVGDPRPDRDRARGAGRGELHEAQVLGHLMIVVGREAHLLDVKGLGPVDVGDGDGDELELHVHEGLPFGLNGM